ncbi:MAG: bis(5'-nucleosyl)-tetraphosphatase (symmetrical) YqeK [Elusimicrobia bacterium]|nr:bis(5'-nucleosyl)-tetraphosphatase (symmetrical) YqeK [Elusimicrobiota bacterium]
MTKNIEQKIYDYLSSHLKPERYNHVLAVNDLAVKLAKTYKLDVMKISTAALLHDCAKNMTFEENLKYIKKNNLKIKYVDFIIKYLPQVLHSYIGADIAKKQFGIKDKEIINSIYNHTIGRIGMSDYEKVIFIADSLSLDRQYKKGFVPKKIMFSDLDQTFKLVLQNKINYVLYKFKVLHPDIIKIWNYYNS